MYELEVLCKLAMPSEIILFLPSASFPILSHS